jgi:dipeptidyl aminopeptidase/acylaminoacyl peptidase
MRPQHLSEARWPGYPTVSPDGADIVYAVTRADVDDDAYRSELWTVPSDGSVAPRRFTVGPRDLSPRFSPDGRWLAFVRATDDGPGQLHVMPSAGGEPWRLTDHSLGVQEIAWSPDSSRIAYTARVPEEGRYGTAEGVTPDKEPPRRITTLKFRRDNIGFTNDRRAHLFVVDVSTAPPEPLQLSDGDADDGGIAWRPDGEEIAFVSARHEDRDTDLLSDVFAVPSGGGPLRQVTATAQPIHPRIAYGPDGSTLYFAAVAGADPVGRTLGVYAIDVEGGTPRRLTDEEDIDVGAALAAPANPLLLDERSLTAPVLRRGAVELVSFDLEGVSPPTTLVGGRCAVEGYARGGDVHAVAVATDTSAGEIVAVRQGGTKTLTQEGAALADAADLRPMEDVHATAPDGYPVHGWVVKPSGPGPFPTLLWIHGGPHFQQGYALLDEAQVYAGAGYAVVLGNPRGSAGYGNAHGRAILGNLGGLDHDDVTALLDAALEDPALDGDRVGVMGGSYGGFMTTWMIAHSDRFRAAIVERALTAPDSFLGSSDIGSFFTDMYFGSDPERRRAQSPLAKADAIRTPTLIIHSEQDWRCPVEQAQRLFVALKRNGVETELLLFPGEGHELSRSGLPSHRIARFEAILEWFGRYLT